MIGFGHISWCMDPASPPTRLCASLSVDPHPPLLLGNDQHRESQTGNLDLLIWGGKNPKRIKRPVRSSSRKWQPSRPPAGPRFPDVWGNWVKVTGLELGQGRKIQHRWDSFFKSRWRRSKRCREFSRFFASSYERDFLALPFLRCVSESFDELRNKPPNLRTELNHFRLFLNN